MLEPANTIPKSNVLCGKLPPQCKRVSCQTKQNFFKMKHITLGKFDLLGWLQKETPTVPPAVVDALAKHGLRALLPAVLTDIKDVDGAYFQQFYQQLWDALGLHA